MNKEQREKRLFWEDLRTKMHIDEDGNKRYYVKGKLHRQSGPAVEWVDGDNEWYLNGEELSEDSLKFFRNWPLTEFENLFEEINDE